MQRKKMRIAEEYQKLSLKLDCLKALLIDDSESPTNDERVTIDRFGQVMTWFGPIDLEKNTEILEVVCYYFHNS